LLNHEANEVELADYDEVVLASGISPRTPAFPGVEHKSVAGYVDVLSGRVPPGERVAILGAGGIGFDVAIYLLERNGRTQLEPAAFASHWGIVTDAKSSGGLAAGNPRDDKPEHRITMLKRSTTPFGSTLGKTTGWTHRIELARAGVEMLRGVEYRKIDDAGVHITVEGKERVIPADTVVLCTGQDPLRSLVARLETHGKKAHLIGGAREAGELDAKRAMREGAELAAAI
jgi:2,4-dienoyl-CoA reductase (NADPH2)